MLSSLMQLTIVYDHVNRILVFPITHGNTSMFCQSEYTYIYQTEKMRFSLCNGIILCYC